MAMQAWDQIRGKNCISTVPRVPRGVNQNTRRMERTVEGEKEIWFRWQKLGETCFSSLSSWTVASLDRKRLGHKFGAEQNLDPRRFGAFDEAIVSPVTPT